MIIGICGKSGSGKSTLANQIKELVNKPTIHLDIDKIGHQVLTFPEVKKELLNNFVNSILIDDDINRKKLGELVFNSRDKMDTLTEITWKHMQIEIDKIIDANLDKIIILDWILLPKSKYFNQCNYTILLNIPYNIREERAMRRDNISNKDFATREKASIEYNLEDFDYVLEKNELGFANKLVKLL